MAVIQKKHIVFAHSAGPQYGPGKGSYDLVKFLRAALGTDYRIHFPIIEKPNSPSYEKYKALFETVFQRMEDPVILIGHSLGGSTLLKYLSEEKPGIAVSGLFLVATPFWKSSMKEFQLAPHFEDALKDIKPVFLYHSKDDPEVPFDHVQQYAAAFKTATLRALPGEQHVFSMGLPELVEDVKTVG